MHGQVVQEKDEPESLLAGVAPTVMKITQGDQVPYLKPEAVVRSFVENVVRDGSCISFLIK